MGLKNEEVALSFWGKLMKSEVGVKGPPVSLGEHRLLCPPLEGFALIHEGDLIHLVAFPREIMKE